MLRKRMLIWGCSLAFVPGCYSTEQKTTLVPENPFGRPPVIRAPANPTLPRASLENAAHVDQIGNRIMAANRQLGMRVSFYTIGSPEPELFHSGSSNVYITEGLIKRCPTDGQLASLLCLELARMVGEREALATPQVRLPEKSPPMEVVPGNDYAGAAGPAEMLHRAEVGKYEQERRERIAAAHTPPDPQILAKEILVKSGFLAADFDAAVPLLKDTEGGALSKQLVDGPQSLLRK
jgi:hypothetical protein